MNATTVDVVSASKSATVDGIVDSIQSPQTTGSPIPPQVMKANVLIAYIAGNSWLTWGPYNHARPDLAAKGLILPCSLTYAVTGRPKRCIYDMEPGGGDPRNIGFFAARVDRSEPFYLYTFAAAGAAMLAWAQHFGFEQGRDFYYISAHANGRKHICRPDVCGYPRADITQFLFGGSFDLSVAYAYALPSTKPKPRVDPYALFPPHIGDPRLPNNGNERLTVEECDGALQAYHRNGKYRSYLLGKKRGEIKEFRDRCKRVATFLPPDFTRPNPHPWPHDNRHLPERWQALNNRMKQIDAIR